MCWPRSYRAGRACQSGVVEPDLVYIWEQSPNHSHCVSLVLNLCTGHVSPHFHVKHDEFFETVNGWHHNYDAQAATWKELNNLACPEAVMQHLWQQSSRMCLEQVP